MSEKPDTRDDDQSRAHDADGGDAVRRREMLLEMGISPVWKLRQAAEAPVAGTRVPELPVATAAIGSAPAVAEVATSQEPARIAKMDWEALEASVSTCEACGLYAKRNKTVFGVGDRNADWLFVGEAPGAEEDAQGEPFVGQAGALLDNMLSAISLKRGANVYIANIVKCRPPGNRNPQTDEAQACAPFLQRQIALIQPKLIIALGKVAAVNLLGNDASIASLRGQLHDWRGIPLIVTYHPAYLLRTLHDKAKAWEDLCFAVATMQRLQQERPNAT